MVCNALILKKFVLYFFLTTMTSKHYIKKYLIPVAVLFSLQLSSIKAQDSNYVKKYDNMLSVKILSYYDGFDFKDKVSGLNYIPGLHTGVGTGFYFKYIPFDFSVRQEFSGLGDAKYHKRKTTNMQLKGYSKYFAGDIFIQKYNGFYTSEVVSYKTKYKTLKELEYKPDLEIFLLDAVGKYIFNHEHFSYKAGFTAYERQLISSGSFMCGASLHLMKIKSDSTLVRINNSSDLKTCNFGVNTGYAYNFVFGKRSTLFSSILLGLNVSNLLKKAEDNPGLLLWPSCYFKGAYWLNFDKWSLGLTCVYNVIHHVFEEDVAVYINSRRVELLLIRRLFYKKKSKK